MKFIVSRTSMSESEKPCEKAVPCIIVGGNGNTYNAYEIKINTLEELLEFQKYVDQDLVLRENWCDQKRLEIEIYDTWRE